MRVAPKAFTCPAMRRMNLGFFFCGWLALSQVLPVFGFHRKGSPHQGFRLSHYLDIDRDTFGLNYSGKDARRWLQSLFVQSGRRSASVLEGVRVSYSLRGGELAFHPNNSAPSGPLDVAGRSVSVLLAWVVAFQSAIAALLSYRQHLFSLVARLLKSDTIAAMKTVQTIFESAQDHGVIDVFKAYTTQELVSALYALSRLQATSDSYSSKQIEEFPLCQDEALLDELCHYAPFACAAYGWELDLVTAGRFHRGDLHALTRITKVQQDDIVQVEWESRPNRPAFYIVRDRKRKRLVLSIRGTWSAHDILTDLCCTSEEYCVSSRRHSAHAGMLAAARSVKALAEETIRHELERNPNYSLLLVGHSLGGSVAAILGELWADTFRHLRVYCYGPACVAPLNDMDRKRVISVVLEGDPFSSLSLGHVADVSKALATLCDDDELRTMVLTVTDGPLDMLDSEHIRWCNEKMEEIRTQMLGAKLYPPGRLLFLSYRNDPKGRKGIQQIREITPDVYGELKISARMFDLSRHVPRVYHRRLKNVIRHFSREVR